MRPFRYVAPAGAPIDLRDLASASGFLLRRESVDDALRTVLRETFQVREAFLSITGRAGMTLLLKALRRLAPIERDEVILPSYTCYSVAASVIKAGLRPRLVDISERSLDYDAGQLEAADFRRVLAVVATNLYGYPNDLESIGRIARAHGAFVVDDSAQAMGARRGGSAAGTRGDAGLFSFDKGKNVSAIDGGVIVTNSPDIAEVLRSEFSTLSAAQASEAVSGVLKAFVYWAMLRPRLYWIPNAVPQLGLGRTVFTTEFPLSRANPPLVALALATIRHLDAFTQVRRRNASVLFEALREAPTVRVPQAEADSEPACLRFPVLMSDRRSRDAVVHSLNAAGIGATGSYPASLATVPELRPLIVGDTAALRAGQSVAARIVTLPTHPFVRAQDLSRMVSAIGAEAAPAPQGMNLCVE